ncbi:hypothetical protein PHK61_14510 [Actinomycetospora lutea]|uniref:hypothetical protein n=1 Tax=Actinomycetospora lutea TaxID=663604 RepID=UPI00236723FA|nr:hypothetical protein [Actinomycetospora lutea]MDD7939633.1 hypothetical protein [Actinomycetospora lutea]
MSTLSPPTSRPAPPAREPHLERLVTGLLLVALGVAWMLDAAGVSVPWRLFPAAALLLTGAALVIAAAGGWPRRGLVGLGAVLLVAAVAVGVHVERFAGPVGDRVVAPTGAEWGVPVRVAAGTATVDLTRHPLPASGRLDVSVGAGRVVLVLPPTSAVRADVEVVTGAVIVDGARVDDGIQARWTEPGPAPVTVAVDVALGEVEVLHAQ